MNSSVITARILQSFCSASDQCSKRTTISEMIPDHDIKTKTHDALACTSLIIRSVECGVGSQMRPWLLDGGPSPRAYFPHRYGGPTRATEMIKSILEQLDPCWSYPLNLQPEAAGRTVRVQAEVHKAERTLRRPEWTITASYSEYFHKYQKTRVHQR